MTEALVVAIGQALRARGWALALGESCTGGMLGHCITNVPGSSEYFLGGIVAYAYQSKE
ncbi:MAG: CinA family protein, partial [Anaerolineales bacterium]|nr:CinA family protein [Anaerolineales bacterium]